MNAAYRPVPACRPSWVTCASIVHSICPFFALPSDAMSVEAKPSQLLGSADTYETDDAVYVKIDIPGMSKKDVTVSVTDGNLHVSGTREKDQSLKDVRFYHSERQYGKFSRLFKLPETADLTKISASCDHGVLTIAVHKTAVNADISSVLSDVTIAETEEEGNGALNSDFAAVPISVFPKPSIGKLVILESTMSIADAVKMLAQYRILAAPVRDMSKPDDAPWTEKYLGMLDMVSIVNYMLEKLEPSGKAPEDFEKETQNLEEFKTTTITAAAKFAPFGPFVPVDIEHGTLLDAMLLCGQHAIRRVPVVKTPGGDIVNIITQSALIQTLSANLDRFAIVGKLPLTKLGLGSPSRVHTVSTTDKLRAAFLLIKQFDVSAVPVIDAATGKIRGNISARDVRLVATSSKVYKLLNMPVSVYLDVVSDGAENSAITCTPEDTLEEVIKRMVRSRIHRIYVVDSQQHVIRVVSLRNILRKFVKEPENYFGHYFGY